MTSASIVTTMAKFVDTVNPCPYNFFSSDPDFQSDADSIRTYVLTKLGNPVLSVELASKTIWMNFEDAVCEYSKQIANLKIKSELANLLGMSTGSAGDAVNKYPRQTLEFLIRQADPYASQGGTGGSYDAQYAYFDMVSGQQDYNFYTDMKSFVSGTNFVSTMAAPGKIRVMNVFHVSPLAAQQMLLNASNVTNFLATEFNYESYVNSTIFYVLPVFEDVLRRGMLEEAYKVRRSNYSYEIYGSVLRIYPTPMTDLQTGKLFIKVATPQDPLAPPFHDSSITGVSGPNQVPFGNIPYSTINQPGRQWIRQYTLALCKENLGYIRSKYKTIPIPNADLMLDGEELKTEGRDDKEKLLTEMKEFLENLTTDKMLELQAARVDNIRKSLSGIPVPGGPIKIG